MYFAEIKEMTNGKLSIFTNSKFCLTLEFNHLYFVKLIDAAENENRVCGIVRTQ